MKSALQKATSQSNLNNQLPLISELADRLLERQASPGKALVVPFIGAGASAGANVPLSGELQRRIYEGIVEQEGTSGLLAKALDDEALCLFDSKAKYGISRLSLFEFAAVISRFAYARERKSQIISSVTTQASHRPLVYELLAHLAKHRFVDHFVSLNFDELLDEALKDELPERLRLITNPDEVPGPRFIRNPKSSSCYVLKPFGSLSNDNYKLTPDEIARYGAQSVWHFMRNNIFRPSAGDTLPEIILILVGYAAAEPAFAQLIDELLYDPQRKVTIFLVDIRKTLPDGIKKIKGPSNLKIIHIRTTADLAFDILVRILEHKYGSPKSNKVWIPVARHRIIASLPYRDIKADRRFKMELILQAIKSRGFFTIEAVAEIDRITKYSNGACKVIQQICEEGILIHQDSIRNITSSGTNYLRHDYSIKSYEDDTRVLHRITTKLLETSGIKPDDKINELDITHKDDKYTVESRPIKYKDFFVKRFKEIESAPEIEVSVDANPATFWLFNNARSLTTVTELTETTAELFNTALGVGGDSTICLYGVWTTGEWLFHDDGWAWKTIGMQVIDLLKQGKLNMSIVLARNPIEKTIRQVRGDKVLERLREFNRKGCCKICQIDWWELNRVLTLLTWDNNGKREEAGIYMRRRLATPLVAPVLVRGTDCSVLKNIYDHYEHKASRNQRHESVITAS